MDATPLADALFDAKERLENLAPPCPKNPNTFHEEKSELVAILGQIHSMMAGNWKVPAIKKPQAATIKPGKRVVKGNVIQVEFRHRRASAPAH